MMICPEKERRVEGEGCNILSVSSSAQQSPEISWTGVQLCKVLHTKWKVRSCLFHLPSRKTHSALRGRAQAGKWQSTKDAEWQKLTKYKKWMFHQGFLLK